MSDKSLARTLTGLPPIDEVTGGLRPGQVWMHCGGVASLKSTWAMNWALRAAANDESPAHVVFASFERSQHDLDRALIAIHRGLDIRKVRRRGLDSAEIALLQEGELWPASLETLATIERTMPDLARSKAPPVDMLIVDSAAMVTPVRKDARRHRLEVYRDAKLVAIGTNGLPPMGVLMIQQLNRAAISSRSGEVVSLDEGILETVDVVTTTWQDEALKIEGRAIFRMLKNRDGHLAKPFLVSIDPATRRMAYVGELPRPDENDLLNLV